MAGEYGIGLGINQGLQQVDAALLRRQQIQMAAEDQEMKRKQFAQQTTQNGLKEQELQMKIDAMEKQQTKAVTFQAFDAFEQSKDPKFLNLAKKDSPRLAQMMEKRGTVSFNKVSDLSPEKLASLGYKEEDYVRPVIETKADGKQVITEMFGIYASLGYLDRANENVMNDFKLKIEQKKLAAEEAEAEIGEVENSTYLKYVDEQIAKGEMPLSKANFQDFQLTQKETNLETKTKAAEAKLGGGVVDYTKIKTKSQVAVELANLETIPEDQRTPLQKNLVEKFSAYMSTEGEDKREIISKGLDTTNKFLGGFDGKEVTLEDVKAAQSAEALIGKSGDKKTVQEISSNYTTLKQGYKLTKKVGELAPEELQRGLLDTGLMSAKKLLSDTAFDKLSTEEKANSLQTIKFNTRLGSYLADYIRSISGTAASEAEFTRLKEVLTGGSFNNTQTLKAALDEFVALEDEKFRSNLDSKYVLAEADVLNFKYKYDKEIGKSQGSTSTKTISKEAALAEARRRGLVK